MGLTAFISGHLDITENEFKEHYIPKIDDAILKNHYFLVGDAKGADTMAQEYLKNKTENVIVFHMFDSPHNNKGDFPTIGGFSSDEERDKGMTLISNYDIAWIREGKEKSGTAKNISRRMKKFLLHYTVQGVETFNPLCIIVNAFDENVAKVRAKNSKFDCYNGKDPDKLTIHTIEEVSNEPLQIYLEKQYDFI